MKSNTNVMKLNWDNLIMLDACRYDTFRYNYEDYLSGSLSCISSPAVETSMWTMKCLSRDHKDVVCISSQPFLSDIKLKEHLGFNPFYHIEPVWDYGWNDELGTVHPHSVVVATDKIIKRYPDKRLLIWFLQPHFPCIGKYPLGSWDSVFRWSSPKLWLKWFGHKSVSLDYAKTAYTENLRMVLNIICRDLLPLLSGRTLISSDHGESFGNDGVFSHKGSAVGNGELRSVPLLEVNNGA